MSDYTLRSDIFAEKSKAKPLIYEGASELVLEGHFPFSGLTLGVGNHDHVVYAERGPGDIVGIICYRMSLHQQLYVTLVYVEPSSRKTGVFKALFAEMLKGYEKHPPYDVLVPSHHDNQVWKKILIGMGFKPHNGQRADQELFLRPGK